MPASNFPICCCWSRAGIASCWWSKRRAAIAAWRRPSTMRWARLSTRARRFSGWAIPAARRWSGWRAEGNAKAVRLPRPLLGSAEPHFSFAGLKSAVMRAKVAQQLASTSSGRADVGFEQGRRSAQPEPVEGPAPYTDADIAASFQQAAIECVIDRTTRALESAGEVSALVVAGGVAANKAVRAALEHLAAAHPACASSRRPCRCAPTMPR